MQQTEAATLLTRFIAIMKSGRPLSKADRPMIDALLDRYPFFTLPAAKMLESGATLTESERRRFSAAIALNTPDSNSLMKLIDPDGLRFESFYPQQPEPATPTTEKAIDTFLDQYGNIDRHEQDLLERLIFNPVPDYSQVLAREAETESATGPLSEQDAMLDAFLASQENTMQQTTERDLEAQQSRHATPATPKPGADSSLNESLAQIYIKQHRYDKAHEIISQLSLNFPKKSVYFADQLRFLKKLMLINRLQSKRQTEK